MLEFDRSEAETRLVAQIGRAFVELLRDSVEKSRNPRAMRLFAAITDLLAEMGDGEAKRLH